MSILAGVETIVLQSLGLEVAGSSSSRQPRKAAPGAEAGAMPAGFDALCMLEDAYLRLTDNLERELRIHAWRPSPGNWRFEKELAASSHDATVETTLERAIASATGPEWANHVPVAAGLSDDASDAGRRIDLVFRRDPRCYELIELRVRQGTALEAAGVALQHALLYLLAREHYPPWELTASDLLLAEEVHLRVLAPDAFYSGCQLGWLESALDASLPGFSAARIGKPVLASFGFERFPPGFRWPAARSDVVEPLLRREGVWRPVGATRS